MAHLTASRTLVKSTPELWAECSDAASLARHLGAFGEIIITKLEPETAVAWEGEDVRGTVTLEPSGWGTRVVLTASAAPANAGVPAGVQDGPSSPAAPEAEPPPEVKSHAASEAEPHPAAEAEPESAMAARPGFLRRLFAGWRRSSPPTAVAFEPESAAPRRPAATQLPQPHAPAASPPKATAPPKPEPQPTPAGTDALIGALDSLGKAHRRPFSHA